MLIFGSVMIFAVLFVFFAVPEVKGLTLEQVDEMYDDRSVRPWNSARWTPSTGHDRNRSARNLQLGEGRRRQQTAVLVLLRRALLCSRLLAPALEPDPDGDREEQDDEPGHEDAPVLEQRRVLADVEDDGEVGDRDVDDDEEQKRKALVGEGSSQLVEREQRKEEEKTHNEGRPDEGEEGLRGEAQEGHADEGEAVKGKEAGRVALAHPGKVELEGQVDHREHEREPDVGDQGHNKAHGNVRRQLELPRQALAHAEVAHGDVEGDNHEVDEADKCGRQCQRLVKGPRVEHRHAHGRRDCLGRLRGCARDCGGVARVGGEPGRGGSSRNAGEDGREDAADRAEDRAVDGNWLRASA
ncbi:hypothetical protein L7F22_007290 [Adiantum nelumboides]|nr:hypothetical protein [Adiantum nelumboides]